MAKRLRRESAAILANLSRPLAVAGASLRCAWPLARHYTSFGVRTVRTRQNGFAQSKGEANALPFTTGGAVRYTRVANGRTAAECYALGLDPADATNDFRIVSIEMVDGEPKVEWEPKVNRWTGAEIQAVLKGTATLDGEWKAVEGATAAEKAAMRFFKVVVEVQ